MRFVAPILSIFYLVSIIFGFLSYDGSEIDAFLPAFGLSPFGIPALALSLLAVLKQIRTRPSYAWALWLLAAALSIILAAIGGFLLYLFLLKGGGSASIIRFDANNTVG